MTESASRGSNVHGQAGATQSESQKEKPGVGGGGGADPAMLGSRSSMSATNSANRTKSDLEDSNNSAEKQQPAAADSQHSKEHSKEQSKEQSKEKTTMASLLLALQELKGALEEEVGTRQRLQCAHFEVTAQLEQKEAQLESRANRIEELQRELQALRGEQESWRGQMQLARQQQEAAEEELRQVRRQHDLHNQELFQDVEKLKKMEQSARVEAQQVKEQAEHREAAVRETMQRLQADLDDARSRRAAEGAERSEVIATQERKISMLEEKNAELELQVASLLDFQNQEATFGHPRDLVQQHSPRPLSPSGGEPLGSTSCEVSFGDDRTNFAEAPEPDAPRADGLTEGQQQQQPPSPRTSFATNDITTATTAPSLASASAASTPPMRAVTLNIAQDASRSNSRSSEEGERIVTPKTRPAPAIFTDHNVKLDVVGSSDAMPLHQSPMEEPGKVYQQHLSQQAADEDAIRSQDVDAVIDGGKQSRRTETEVDADVFVQQVEHEEAEAKKGREEEEGEEEEEEEEEEELPTTGEQLLGEWSNPGTLNAELLRAGSEEHWDGPTLEEVQRLQEGSLASAFGEAISSLAMSAPTLPSTLLSSSLEPPSSVHTPRTSAASGAQRSIHLTQRDLSEIKALKKPPPPIRLLMEVCCLIFNIQPVKLVDERSAQGRLRCDYWEPARRYLLSDPFFLQKLRTYNNTLSIAQRAKIRRYFKDPEFTADRVRTSSKAAFELYGWVDKLMQEPMVANSATTTIPPP